MILSVSESGQVLNTGLCGRQHGFKAVSWDGLCSGLLIGPYQVFLCSVPHQPVIILDRSPFLALGMQM